MKQVKFGDSEMTGCGKAREESKPKYLKIPVLFTINLIIMCTFYELQTKHSRCYVTLFVQKAVLKLKF